MGIEQSFKRKNKKNIKKNSKQKASEVFNEKKVIKKINNSYGNNSQSKKNKILNQNKEILDEPTYKLNSDNLKCLKNLSFQNTENLENYQNTTDTSGDSLDTNFGSNKSKEEINKILNDDFYDDMEDTNSFEEEEENDKEDEINDIKEKEEEKKQKKLMLTNNIKTVFIDSKLTSKEHNDSPLNDDEDRLSNTSSSTFDYELNFYRNGNDIRQSYLAKLISTQVWNPNMKPKQHNSIIIFDWDDTLLPTTFLTPGGIFEENMKLSDVDKNIMSKLEESVLKLLTESVEKGNVYIITNAGKGWVEYSAKKFYPSIMTILSKIKIISARGEYEKAFPGDSRQWKIEAFLNLKNTVNMNLVTNIICIGDSLFEMEAGRILASKFSEAFIKTVKFKEAPKMDELIKQLNVVYLQFGTIYSSIKNLTIRVEKKKKEKI